MENRRNYFVYLAAISANLLALASGWGYAWSSPAIPKLSHPELGQSPLQHPTTTTENTWITSILNLGSAFGPIIAGQLADVLGRKKTLLLISVPMIIANIITTFAWNVELFYLSRFLTGVGCGSIFTVMPMYIAEISEVYNRGVLSCFLGIGITFSVLLSYFISPHITIQMMGYLGLVPLILFVLIFGYFIPESPYFYVLKNDVFSAEKSLKQIRKKSDVYLQKELMEIVRNVEENKSSKGSVVDLFKAKTPRKTLIICLSLMFFQQLTGITGITGYLQIFFEATGSKLRADTSTIIVGASQFFSLLVISTLVERFGRKPLLMVSSFCSGLCLGVLGVYFQFKSLNYNLDAFFWLPVTCVLLYVFFFNLGIGPLPWTIMAEIFPTHVKSLGSTITSWFCLMLSFVISKFFLIIPLYLGMEFTMWGFALFAFVTVIFVYFCVPETKGKTFEEIQDMVSCREKM